MLKGRFTDESLFTKLILTAFVALVGLLIAFFTAILVIYLFYDVHQLSDFSLLFQQNTSVLKILQFFQSIGLFVIPPFAMAYILSHHTSHFLSLNKPKASVSFIAIASMTAAIPFINWLSEQNAAMQFPSFLQGIEQWMKDSEQTAKFVTEKFLETKTIGGLLINIFLMAIIPAIGEELFFRGLLQNFFTKWSKNTHTAIWTTAFIFSAIHFQFYGFIPRMLIGGYFGYLLVWSGSLWVPILAHFTNNALAVVFYYLNSNGYIKMDVDTIGTKETLYVSLISLILSSVLIFFLKKKTHYSLSSPRL